jgi:3-oxoacyl-[acyl-carrier protein] reductase
MMIKNKVALITGAARGIGLGIALKLSGEGYAVAILDVWDEAAIQENLEQVKANGNPVLYFQGDITMAASRQAAIEQIGQEFGRIDLLVNNAGVAPRKRMDILETTQESLDFVIGINVKGTFFMSQAVANFMISETAEHPEIHPMIVNISSMSAYTSSPSRGEYCISKAGVSMITMLFADRLAEYGIPVYEIRPGIIKTDMTKVVTEKYDKLIFEQNLIPIKRWGFPEDIAKAVLLFASGQLPYSTGEIINVDGGYHIRRL